MHRGRRLGLSVQAGQHPGSAGRPERVVEGLKVSHPRARILIVDDLPEKLLVYRTLLEDLEAQIVEAHSGTEALKRVLQSEFAVILLDVNMPDIDGLETANLIRRHKNGRHTPIIFI